MADILQLRRGTAALWTSTNALLASGEWGWETDTTKIKLGDGITVWNSLAYWGDLTDYLKSNVDATLTAGFKATDVNDGTKSSGTYTPDADGGNHKYIINGGAFTLAVPADSSSLIIQVTNNASAGAIDTSAYITTGAALTTANGDDFFLFIARVNGFSLLNVVALQ